MRRLLEGVIRSLESFGYRSRVMIINTRAMTPDKAPATLLEWAEPQWRNRCVITLCWNDRNAHAGSQTKMG